MDIGEKNKNKILKLSKAFKKVKDGMVILQDPLSPEAAILESITFQSVMDNETLSRQAFKLKTESHNEFFHQYLESRVNQILAIPGPNNPSQETLSDLYHDLFLLNEGARKPASPDTLKQLSPVAKDPISGEEDPKEKKNEMQVVFPLRSTTDKNTGVPEDDDLEDQYAICQTERETQEEYYNRFPNLPRSRCPPRLYISTLRPKYLNDLYNIDAEAFPVHWEDLKWNDPNQAWHSLNQTVIKYSNERWKNQGIRIGSSETLVDFYNITELKSCILETIDNHLKSREEGLSSTQQPLIDKNYDLLEKTIKRTEELYRVVQSDLVKFRNQDLNPSRPVYIQNPTLLSPQTDSIQTTNQPSKFSQDPYPSDLIY